MSAVSIGNFVACVLDPIENTMLHLLPNFTQNFMSNLFSKIRSLIFATKHISYQRHNFRTTGVNALKSYMVQVQIRTGMSGLQLSLMDPFK